MLFGEAESLPYYVRLQERFCRHLCLWVPFSPTSAFCVCVCVSFLKDLGTFVEQLARFLSVTCDKAQLEGMVESCNQLIEQCSNSEALSVCRGEWGSGTEDRSVTVQLSGRPWPCWWVVEQEETNAVLAEAGRWHHSLCALVCRNQCVTFHHVVTPATVEHFSTFTRDTSCVPESGLSRLLHSECRLERNISGSGVHWCTCRSGHAPWQQTTQLHAKTTVCVAYRPHPL